MFLFAAVTVLGPAMSQARWLDAAHTDRGLPAPAAVWAPYHADPEHALNCVFRSLWLVRIVPKEIGKALPREHGDDVAFFAEGWYFGKREGADADARWFGGDSRQLPRERFDADESAALRRHLAAVEGAVVRALQNEPRLAVWFQSDLLRLARRLLDTKENGELQAPLLACAERVALPAATLTGAGLATFALADLTLVAKDLDVARLVELERRSTRLFDAEHSGMWSSVFVDWPATEADGLAAWLPRALASPKDPPPLPVGTRAVLVQGLVALDDTGTPRATDIVVDVRVQTLANRDALAAANATATRDGVDFRVFWLERQVVREAGVDGGLAAFREVAMQDQVLFRDYGTSKHTTVMAQCALCHRRTHTRDEPLAGFLVLRPSAQPRPVADAGERRRRAEAEFAKFLAQLRSGGAK